MNLHDAIEIITLAVVVGGGFLAMKGEQRNLKEAVERLSEGLKEVVHKLRTVSVQESRLDKMDEEIKDVRADVKALEGMTIDHESKLARISGELTPVRR